MSSTVKKQWDSRAKTGFVFRILPGRHCPSSAFFVADFFFSSVLLVSFKVNRSLTQGGTRAVFLQQVINLHVRPACHRLKVLCLEWFMGAVSCRVRLGSRGRGFDGGEGVAGGAAGLVSVRFVQQEDWSVAAPRVPSATHTSAINHIPPGSTECFVFSSFRTSAASCHHPEKSLLQDNYRKVGEPASAVP